MRGLSATHALCLCQASSLDFEASLYITTTRPQHSCASGLSPATGVHGHSQMLPALGIPAVHISILLRTLGTLL